MKHAKYQFLNSFILKLIAVFTMTLSHIGTLLLAYSKLSPSDPSFFTDPLSLTSYIFLCIGRLALPLFILLFAEAMRHSHDKGKYIARMWLIGVILMVVEVIIYFVFHIGLDNIFLTFASAGTFILLIERKDAKRWLSILPVVLVIMGYLPNFFVDNQIWWPMFLRPQYSIYGFILMLLFYYSYKLSDLRVLNIAKDNGSTLPIETLRDSSYYRTTTNIFWILSLLVVNLFFWLLSYFSAQYDFFTMSIQSYSLFAILPIIFYNGIKGYSSNKILKYSFYVYYPVHLGIIVLVCYLAFGYLPF